MSLTIRERKFVREAAAIALEGLRDEETSMILGEGGIDHVEEINRVIKAHYIGKPVKTKNLHIMVAMMLVARRLEISYEEWSSAVQITGIIC